MKNAKDSMFALVKASRLSLKDEFMKHEPESDNQRALKKLLTEAIKNGLSDFWAPKLDPSFNEDRTGLIFEAGKMPALGKSYDWWEIKAKEYLPERDSHLGTLKEKIVFWGVFIKSLIASGWSVSNAWKAVCDDSRELGHYWNSENAKHDFEATGSREICGFCDLANTCKILACDKEAGDFWLVGGGYDDDGDDNPLADMNRCANRGIDCGGSVGWIVLSK